MSALPVSVAAWSVVRPKKRHHHDPSRIPPAQAIGALSGASAKPASRLVDEVIVRAQNLLDREDRTLGASSVLLLALEAEIVDLMTTFLAIAESSKLAFQEYSSRAEGILAGVEPRQFAGFACVISLPFARESLHLSTLP